MPVVNVELNKLIKPNELEKILVDSAKEIKYIAQVSEKTTRNYELGSVKRIQKPTGIIVVKLSKFFMPLIEVEFDKNNPQYGLILSYGFGVGLSTRGKVEKYLAAVSKRL